MEIRAWDSSTRRFPTHAFMPTPSCKGETFGGFLGDAALAERLHEDTRLLEAFHVLAPFLRVGDDAGAGLEMNGVAFQDKGADQNIQIDVARVAEPARAPKERPARQGLQLL